MHAPPVVRPCTPEILDGRGLINETLGGFRVWWAVWLTSLKAASALEGISYLKAVRIL